MIVASIYCIVHPARPMDAYVGQTIMAPAVRMRAHRNAVGRSSVFLYRWWAKRVQETGVEPSMVVLRQAEFETREKAKAWLDATEVAAIAWARALPNARCLNCTAGGDGCVDPAPETRAKMAASAKARPPRSVETRAKMSAALRRALANPDVRARMSASKRGRKNSPAHVAKVAAALRGYVHSEETRERMSAGRQGMRLSETHRKAIGDAHRGRVDPPDVRAKKCAAAKARGAKITHCPKGHEYNDANPKRREGCRACRRRGPRTPVTQCPRGHAYDETNPKHPKGCQICQRAASDRCRRARRAAARQAQEIST